VHICPRYPAVRLPTVPTTYTPSQSFRASQAIISYNGNSRVPAVALPLFGTGVKENSPVYTCSRVELNLPPYTSHTSVLRVYARPLVYAKCMRHDSKQPISHYLISTSELISAPTPPFPPSSALYFLPCPHPCVLLPSKLSILRIELL